ncbi:VOC family protein [Paenibacillus sp. P96]|uniref:VOC family protein n=1 Tax=Paenibacillus zeirhizosphaerae TaxID=2987519 RepID=A0ABT9FVG8_9BACL|nr:VOC family protein [Paenibacillus sp. P96]MDP4098728.1 VOC family protein [Paenibacillus sp. P96]
MKPQIHPATDIGLVSLKIKHLERSISFYTEVIGLKLLKREERRAEMTADGMKPLVILHEIDDALVLPERSGAGLYHFAILVPNRASLGLVVRNLIRNNIPVGQGDHTVSEALYLSDPDNNGIELYADRPRDTWKRDSTGHYVMGTDPVDVEGLLAVSDHMQWTGLPAGTVIGHVHFHVSNLQDAEQFYVNLLGFDITARYGSMALFISAGGYHHHIGLNTWAGEGAPPVPENAAGIDYFTLRLPDQTALDEVVTRLTESGYSLTQRAGGLFVKDPFNIGIRLEVKSNG